MKKILIIYATAGIGHKKASMAVKKALDEMNPKDTEVTMIDALDYTNAFFKWSYLQSYLFMVNKLPTFWGILYYLTDNRYINMVVAKIRRFSNWMNSGKLVKYINQTKPDVIISTHFFASEVVGDMKKCPECGVRLITVVTDYRLHAWWVAKYTDSYVVANEDAKEDFVEWKVSPEKIRVLGIPVEPVFAKKLDRKAIFEKTGLKDGIFTVLVIGGGFGVGPIEGIVNEVGKSSAKVQMAVVCGHNDGLVRRIEEIKPSLSCDIKALGFIDNVYEYMEISDILISKSGGITVSESLAKGLPMIVIAPIIGQETRNCDFIVKHHAAFRISHVNELESIIEDLVRNPDKNRSMKDSILSIKKPMACFDVAKLALEEYCGK